MHIVTMSLRRDEPTAATIDADAFVHAIMCTGGTDLTRVEHARVVTRMFHVDVVMFVLPRPTPRRTPRPYGSAGAPWTPRPSPAGWSKTASHRGTAARTWTTGRAALRRARGSLYTLVATPRWPPRCAARWRGSIPADTARNGHKTSPHRPMEAI